MRGSAIWSYSILCVVRRISPAVSGTPQGQVVPRRRNCVPLLWVPACPHIHRREGRLIECAHEVAQILEELIEYLLRTLRHQHPRRPWEESATGAGGVLGCRWRETVGGAESRRAVTPHVAAGVPPSARSMQSPPAPSSRSAQDRGCAATRCFFQPPSRRACSRLSMDSLSCAPRAHIPGPHMSMALSGSQAASWGALQGRVERMTKQMHRFSEQKHM